jgi:membrane fusion protein (multidrug efflux system)
MDDESPKAEPFASQPGETASPGPPPPPVAAPPKSRRKAVIIIVAAILALLALVKLWRSFGTESTDDAYVNGYVTFVAPRVAGQVAKVLAEDNNRVKKGDPLVQLDPEPYQVQLAIKQAAFESAQAALVVAQATTRSQVAQARSQRFKLAHAIEDVNNQIALLRARAATLEQSKATQTLAEAEYERARKLLATKVMSIEEFDQKREALDVARAQVKQAFESVSQARVALGLPGVVPEGTSLTDVPADLNQTFSSVRQAAAELIQAASVLGVQQSSYDLTPQQMLDEFYKRDPGGDIDKIYSGIIKDAPGLKQAEAALLKAQHDREEAQLDLRYCNITAEIDGVVTRRNVNPGNHVQVGQSLMAVRSLRDIWVDANFKETQLRHLRIGQKVDLEVDMYGRKHQFAGRISGFTMGTGSTLALLPAQNATGNFVKVVQRLPVRIDLLDYDPDKLPLFVGLSVEPIVDIKSEPSGPNAGKFLQDGVPASAAANAAPAKP